MALGFFLTAGAADPQDAVKIEIVASQPCWVIENGTVRLAITQMGAQMAPVTFCRDSDRAIQPYYVSPWQGEGLKLDPPVLVPLRGDFFCLPFGSNSAPYEGMKFPLHGEPADKLPREVAWTTATNQDGGYLWFSMRDPRILPMTVFWIENHGRHGVPWNGRNRCLGLEDVCSYVNEGMPISAQPNDINAQGIPTAIELAADRPTVVNYIQGVAKIPPDFRMVKDIELGAGEVTFVSVTGKKVSLPLDFEFARTGKL
ncbi:MAG: hypothetical protein A2W03_02170 [Candidatus Aminicenantes bacterium RBG_16_63_16]|nr:MAG: hypothetical protein A2W03_02170 [Candidatus Aminicenantes bacterium RBG_16_63_16]